MIITIVSFVAALTVILTEESNVHVFAFAATGNLTSFMLNESHLTDRPAFISLANTSDQQPTVGEIKPIITSGENLSNGYPFPGIPDGLGAVELENGTVDVYVNHEYDTEAGHFL